MSTPRLSRRNIAAAANNESEGASSATSELSTSSREVQLQRKCQDLQDQLNEALQALRKMPAKEFSLTTPPTATPPATAATDARQMAVQTAARAAAQAAYQAVIVAAAQAAAKAAYQSVMDAAATAAIPAPSDNPEAPGAAAPQAAAPAAPVYPAHASQDDQKHRRTERWIDAKSEPFSRMAEASEALKSSQEQGNQQRAEIEDHQLGSLAARHTGAQNLPLFSGDPIEWIGFKAQIQQSTDLCRLGTEEKLVSAPRSQLGPLTPPQTAAALLRSADGSREAEPPVQAHMVPAEPTSAPREDSVPPHAALVEQRAVSRTKMKKALAARLTRGRDSAPLDAAPDPVMDAAPDPALDAAHDAAMEPALDAVLDTTPIDPPLQAANESKCGLNKTRHCVDMSPTYPATEAVVGTRRM